MSEVDRIQDQLERAYRGEAWHGPDVRSILSGLDPEDAFARPIAGVHTVAELVRHLVAWEREAVERIEGRGSELPEERDWPEGRDSAAAWDALVEDLDSAHRALSSAISCLTDDELEREVPGSPGTLYHLLHGVVQHNLYHAGQIVLLRKALAAVRRR